MELSDSGERHMRWPKTLVFPTRNYYYGGLFLPGQAHPGMKSLKVDCGRMMQYFPFVHREPLSGEPDVEMETLMVNTTPLVTTFVSTRTGQTLSSPRTMTYTDVQASQTKRQGPMRTYTDSDTNQALLLPAEAWDLSFAAHTWNISLERRAEWMRNTNQRSGNYLTQQIDNLNIVEIDNSISKSCLMKTPLKIIEFNAERGKHWFLTAQMVQGIDELRDADILILNEMDIGMARSRNE